MWVSQAVIDDLGKRGFLRDPVSTASTVARLLSMQSQAVHGAASRISQEQADDYVWAAILVEDLLIRAMYSSLAAERRKTSDGANEWRQSSEQGSADPA
jgi:hypothetical protein